MVRLNDNQLCLINGGGLKNVFTVLAYHMFKMLKSYFRFPRFFW